MVRKPRKPPRRHAKQKRSRETVRAVLEAAARILRRNGYAGATTNHIAEVAGVSIGTLYQYFADKDEIFDALVTDYFDQVVESIRGVPIDASRPLKMTLRELITAGLGAQRHGPALLRALDQVPNTVFRRRLESGKRQVITFFRHVLERYEETLRPIDLERAAALLIHASEGIGYNEKAADYPDELADELTELFVRYLVEPGRAS